MKIIFLITFLFIVTVNSFSQYSAHSIYTIKPKDGKAVYFDYDNFNVIPDGKTDCTEELQKAIDSDNE